MICHDLIESMPFSEYSGQLPKHSHHIKAPTWSMRPQRTRASRTLGKTVPCSMTIPGSLRSRIERSKMAQGCLRHCLNPHRYCFATQFGTSSTYPWSSMRGSRRKGSTKHWHLWWQTNSTSARQIRNKAQTQTECFMHFTHCHGSPSPPSKPILQERNTSKQKCYFWVKAFILEIWDIWYISDIYLSMCLWFRFWLFV